MSTLNYEPAPIVGLPATDRVFKVTSGSDTNSLIRITIARSEEDFDGDGVPDQINLKVSGSLVDEMGAPIKTNSGALIQIPAKVEGVLTSAIAEGLININEFRSNMTDEAIHRVLRQKAALLAWETIPVAFDAVELTEPLSVS